MPSRHERIRKAASLPVGTPERKRLLASLADKTAFTVSIVPNGDQAMSISVIADVAVGRNLTPKVLANTISKNQGRGTVGHVLQNVFHGKGLKGISRYLATYDGKTARLVYRWNFKRVEGYAAAVAQLQAEGLL